MRKTKTRTYDAAERLDSPEEIAAYLEAAVEDGAPRVLAHALETVAQARGLRLAAEPTRRR